MRKRGVLTIGNTDIGDSDEPVSIEDRIRHLYNENPNFASVIKKEFPEVFKKEREKYVAFSTIIFKGDFTIDILKDCAHEVKVKPGEGLLIPSNIEIVIHKLQYGASALLFKLK